VLGINHLYKLILIDLHGFGTTAVRFQGNDLQAGYARGKEIYNQAEGVCRRDNIAW
jgi:hypothetical protein